MIIWEVVYISRFNPLSCFETKLLFNCGRNALIWLITIVINDFV